MSFNMFLSFFQKEIKVFEENIPGFFSIMDFSGSQWVEGPKCSF